MAQRSGFVKQFLGPWHSENKTQTQPKNKWWLILSDRHRNSEAHFIKKEEEKKQVSQVSLLDPKSFMEEKYYSCSARYTFEISLTSSNCTLDFRNGGGKCFFSSAEEIECKSALCPTQGSQKSCDWFLSRGHGEGLRKSSQRQNHRGCENLEGGPWYRAQRRLPSVDYLETVAAISSGSFAWAKPGSWATLGGHNHLMVVVRLTGSEDPSWAERRPEPHGQ